jgi:leucyl-tRNA synthetase
VGVPEEELPLILPEVESYEPTGTGESPLANIADWVNTKCPKCGGDARRETNTMPQWAGSSWYYLRYIDPNNNEALVDSEKEKYWSPVDFYVGGAEHATRHLIYARFWHKFLFDIGVVSHDEPFKRLQHVGLIQGEDNRKMSKRWGNVINPDDIVEQYGADSMRVYEMFMGPFAQACNWSTNGLVGARKFLEKVIRVSGKVSDKESDDDLKNILHKTIKKVGEDIEEFKFNTAISQMMILVNKMGEETSINKKDFLLFIQIFAPFAPHLAEEIWSEMGNKESIIKQVWPKYDEKLIVDKKINLVLQVNGKIRATVEVEVDISEDEAKKIAFENELVKKWTENCDILKVIFVKGKLVNIVVK